MKKQNLRRKKYALRPWPDPLRAMFISLLMIGFSLTLFTVTMGLYLYIIPFY